MFVDFDITFNFISIMSHTHILHIEKCKRRLFKHSFKIGY